MGVPRRWDTIGLSYPNRFGWTFCIFLKIALSEGRFAKNPDLCWPKTTNTQSTSLCDFSACRSLGAPCRARQVLVFSRLSATQAYPLCAIMLVYLWSVPFWGIKTSHDWEGILGRNLRFCIHISVWKSVHRVSKTLVVIIRFSVKFYIEVCTSSWPYKYLDRFRGPSKLDTGTLLKYINMYFKWIYLHRYWEPTSD